jgi:hypothetical protein
MAMVREVSPIPAGRYWMVILGTDKQRDFDLWVKEMGGAVRIESTSLNDENPSTEFVIFTVPQDRFPFLNADYFGFPNTAAPNVTQLADVEQSPEPEPAPLWNLPSFPKLEGGTLALLALAALLLLKR